MKLERKQIVTTTTRIEWMEGQLSHRDTTTYALLDNISAFHNPKNRILFRFTMKSNPEKKYRCFSSRTGLLKFYDATQEIDEIEGVKTTFFLSLFRSLAHIVRNQEVSILFS